MLFKFKDEMNIRAQIEMSFNEIVIFLLEKSYIKYNFLPS